MCSAFSNTPPVHSRAWRYGLADPVDLASRSGLEFLQAMLNGDLPAPRIGETLGFHPVEFGQGRAVFEGLPDERHYNPIGGVHGGYAATLLDSCMGCAVHTLLDAGVGYTTIEFKVAFLRPDEDNRGGARGRDYAQPRSTRRLRRGPADRRLGPAARARDNDLHAVSNRPRGGGAGFCGDEGEVNELRRNCADRWRRGRSRRLAGAISNSLNVELTGVAMLLP